MKREWTDEPKQSFKGIVKDRDNWVRYQAAYADQVTADQIAEVEKMLGCGELQNGYSTYICLDCGEQVKVAFSCKSRICSRCGKVHADEWSAKLVGRLFNVVHRHMTFTIASELWTYFAEHPESRELLYEAANATLRAVMQGEPGIVMVLHPYGKDLKVNYHLHILMTEGGLDEGLEWQAQPYISYSGLRKIWQYELLTRIREKEGSRSATGQLVKQLFARYENGFYVYAEPKVTAAQGIGRYIGRYIRHPAIADTRIVAYDDEQVTYYYEQRFEQGQGSKRVYESVPVLEFIHGVVRHIPPKQFKMVRYYGLYAACKAKKIRAKMQAIGKAVGRVIRHLGWRRRIQRDFKRDPLQCPKCGQTNLALFSLTIRSGQRLITIGGFKWLFASGSIRHFSDLDPPAAHVEPQPTQLAFSFLQSP